ncbi:hypothetical protein ABTX35_02450 [Streptomyces sp. NPDC096080]|uniref:hypothetical protein n=1 Tax=Streptomyces sp. NPDC096080 TaxID=3156693 RepID=UPI003333EBD9
MPQPTGPASGIRLNCDGFAFVAVTNAGRAPSALTADRRLCHGTGIRVVLARLDREGVGV